MIIIIASARLLLVNQPMGSKFIGIPSKKIDLS